MEVTKRPTFQNGAAKQQPNGIQTTTEEGLVLSMKTGIWSYIIALRPWSLGVSLIPVMLGNVLAYKTSGQFNLTVFVVSCFALVSIHGAGNLVNAYYDFIRGIDRDRRRRGCTPVLVDGLLKPSEVVTFGAVMYSFSCACLLLITILSTAKMEQLALIFFGGLSNSFLYTGKWKYLALGDVSVMVHFGPVAVLFSYLAQCGQASYTPILYAIPLALSAEAILHSNNTRNLEVDQDAGVKTIAVLIGRSGSQYLYALLLFAPYVIFAVLAMNFSKWFFLPMPTVTKAFNLEKDFRNGNFKELAWHTVQLHFVVGNLFVVACLLTEPNNLTGFPGLG